MSQAEGVHADDGGDRQRQEGERQAAVDAALTLFVERGYRGTSVADVAACTGASAGDIYKSFGTKAALAKAVFDVALAGDHDEVALNDRTEAAAWRDQPDAARKIETYVRQAAERHRRSAEIQLVIRDAQQHDPDVVLVWETILEERLRAMAMFGHHLQETGDLRADLDLEEVRDVLWWGIAIEHYDLLVIERGWSLDRYGAWLGRVLVAALT